MVPRNATMGDITINKNIILYGYTTFKVQPNAFLLITSKIIGPNRSAEAIPAMLPKRDKNKFSVNMMIDN